MLQKSVNSLELAEFAIANETFELVRDRTCGI